MSAEQEGTEMGRGDMGTWGLWDLGKLRTTETIGFGIMFLGWYIS